MQQNSSNFLELTQKYSNQVATVCRRIQSKWGQGRGKPVDFAMEQRKHSKGFMAACFVCVISKIRANAFSALRIFGELHRCDSATPPYKLDEWLSKFILSPANSYIPEFVVFRWYAVESDVL